MKPAEEDAGGKPTRFDSNTRSIPSPIVYVSGDKVRRLLIFRPCVDMFLLLYLDDANCNFFLRDALLILVASTIVLSPVDECDSNGVDGKYAFHQNAGAERNNASGYILSRRPQSRRGLREGGRGGCECAERTTTRVVSWASNSREGGGSAGVGFTSNLLQRDAGAISWIATITPVFFDRYKECERVRAKLFL